MKETQKSNLLCSLNESRHYCQGYILTSSISPQSVLRFKKYNQSLPLSFQAEKYYNFFPYNLENTSIEALSRCISISYLHYQSHQFTFLNFVSVCMCVLFSQSCLTLCGPLDCSPTCSSVHGILQARILEWVAISFSRGSSWPRDQTWVSCIAGRFFTVWATREAPFCL